MIPFAPFRMNRQLSPIVLIGLAVPLLGASAPQTGTLTVDVTNVRSSKGMVRVDVCPQDLFLKDNCPWSGHAVAQRGVTRVEVMGVTPGSYAVQAYLDENNNDKVDRALFGIPKEGIGFSNDAPVHLSPPKWRDAVFEFTLPAKTIHLKLRYFLGPKGPDDK